MPNAHVARTRTVGIAALAMLAVLFVVGATVGQGTLSTSAPPHVGAPRDSGGASPTRGGLPPIAGSPTTFPTNARAATLLQDLMRGGDRSIPSGSDLRAIASLYLPPSVLGKVPDSVLIASMDRALGPHPTVHPLVTAPPVIADVGLAGAVVALICFTAGVETLGIACLAAIVGLIVFTAILYFMGLHDATGIAATAAANLGKLMLSDQAFFANQQAASVATTINALNASSTALGYQAAAAALAQLPNLTYNPSLTLTAGGQLSVAGELASEFEASASWLAAYVAKDIADFGREEGTANSLTQFCPVGYDAGTFGFPSGTSAGGLSNCPSSNPSPVYYASGHVYGGTPPITMGATSNVATCPQVYIQQGTWITLTDSGATTFTGSFIPVAGNAHWTNVTGTSVPDHALINVTWNATSGGYYLCAPTGTVVFYGGMVFPLNPATTGSQPWAPYVYWAPSDNAAALVGNSEGTAGAWFTLVSSNISSTSYYDFLFGGSSNIYEVNLYGGNTNASQNSGSTVPYAGIGNKASPWLNYGNSLMNLLRGASVVGQTYWTFLQALGYTSESQVPVRCVIPTLSQLLPSTIPPSTLATMNVTSALNLYYAELFALGVTFNATDGLTIANFCGKHVVWNPWNGTFGFGTYAYGYVYVQGTGVKSSDGLVNESYAKPSTWNFSGLIYIAPTLGNYSVPVNTSFQLGVANPAVLFVIPFTKTPTKLGSAPVVNRTGPTWCLNPNVAGCNVTWTNFVTTSLVAGNSTKALGISGSVFPTFEIVGSSGTRNISVFLTACFVASSAYTLANPTYKTATTCHFNTTTLNATGSPCGTDVNGCGGGGGPILIAAPAVCGITLPVYSTAVDLFSSFTGTSSLGCLAAEALAAIALLIIVVLVIWVVARIVPTRRT